MASPAASCCCCRDNQSFAKVYNAVRVAEQEFNLNLPTLAYLAVLRTCANDGSVQAAKFALRIVEGLKVRFGMQGRRCTLLSFCLPWYDRHAPTSEMGTSKFDG